MERPLTWQSADVALSIQKNHEQRRRYFVAKRLFDVLVSAVLLVLLSPLLLILAILVVLDSPGPAIFRQERVNLHRRMVNGRTEWRIGTFAFLKFRTMYRDTSPDMHRAYVQAFIAKDEEAMSKVQADAAQAARASKAVAASKVAVASKAAAASDGGRTFKGAGAVQDAGANGVRKLVHDPRVTRLGAFLRKTSLDELPQLWNVLKGDISLVGPRPPIPYEVEMYEPWHRRRLSTIPGVTGLWQITARSSVDFDEMVELDLEYIERQSFWLDLKILLQTPLAILKTRGAV